MQRWFFLILLLLPITMQGAAQVEKIELEYRAFEPEGFDPNPVGQQLKHDDSLKSRLTGIPELAGQYTWFIEARLGNGDDNGFAMMVSLSPDEKKASCVMDMNRNHDLGDEEILSADCEDSDYTFPSRTFMIPMRDHEVQYKAHLRLLYFEPDPYLYLISDGYRLGRITLDSDQFDAALVDLDGNGLYNEKGRDTDQLDIGTDLKRKSEFIWNGTVHAVIYKDRCHLLDVSADDRQTALDFLKDKELDYPIILDSSDEARKVNFAYRANGFPLHYIIDAEGKIVYGQYGSAEGFPKLREVLKELGKR